MSNIGHFVSLARFNAKHYLKWAEFSFHVCKFKVVNSALVDSTRVFLYNARDGDYINASFVSIPDVPSRKYILTQGPMQQTVNHFWLMVWERQCPAIIMLNRFIEKGSLRCHPYFPHNGGSSVLKLSDVGLIVELEEETNTKLFIQRKFNITNTEVRRLKITREKVVNRVIFSQISRSPS
ncbi:unnamed protein product [Trichobilharzia regenti]|nr:unnamed protein product [Trichobilharzia regenti]